MTTLEDCRCRECRRQVLDEVRRIIGKQFDWWYSTARHGSELQSRVLNAIKQLEEEEEEENRR